MAEHMLILKLTSPEGVVKYVTGAFPSACGKTNLAMLVPTLEGWKVETIGDDIAWMKFGDDGRLYAINPEAGFFGVAPGTGDRRHPNAMAALEREHDLHQRRADRRRRHLVGGHDRRAARARASTGTATTGRRRPTTRPRTPTRASPCRPRRCRRWPPSGRTRPACRSTPSCSAAAARPRVPLVREAFDWEHGVFLGATMSSEQTAAAFGTVGQLRFDPFAMLPFCGYNMADYFAALAGDRRHERTRKLPKIFYVNWFRKDDDGKFLWPGFGENSPRAGVGLPPLRRQGRRGRDADRPRARRRASWTPTGSTSRRERAARGADGRPGRDAQGAARRSRSTWRGSRNLPAAAQGADRGARAAPRALGAPAAAGGPAARPTRRRRGSSSRPPRPAAPGSGGSASRGPAARVDQARAGQHARCLATAWRVTGSSAASSVAVAPPRRSTSSAWRRVASASAANTASTSASVMRWRASSAAALAQGPTGDSVTATRVPPTAGASARSRGNRARRPLGPPPEDQRSPARTSSTTAWRRSPPASTKGASPPSRVELTSSASHSSASVGHRVPRLVGVDGQTTS